MESGDGHKNKPKKTQNEFFHVEFSFPSCQFFKVRALVLALKLHVQHYSNKGKSGKNLGGSGWGRGGFLCVG